MPLHDALVQALKDQFIKVVGEKVFGGCTSETQKPYYLARLDDNLAMPMSEQHIVEYNQGSGGELDGKMKSLRSSSARTFNLLGNGPVTLNNSESLPAGTYVVEFEHQLPTLVNNPHPANLDAKLESEDGKTIIYCEMKLAEWLLGKASGLREQYLKTDNFLIPEGSAKEFRKVFASLCDGQPSKDGKYAPALPRYDAFQMLKHALAIYTEMHRKKTSKEAFPEKIVLLNCVWEMSNPAKLGRYESAYEKRQTEEHEQFRLFLDAAKSTAELFEELDIDFGIRYLTFAQMRDALDLDADHRKGLERYIV